MGVVTAIALFWSNMPNPAIPGNGGHVALDGQRFCEEIRSVAGAAAELDVELVLVLADAVDNLIEMHINGFALLGANGLGREADGAFIITPYDSRSRGLRVTEGVEDFVLVDTHLGVGSPGHCTSQEAAAKSEHTHV